MRQFISICGAVFLFGTTISIFAEEQKVQIRFIPFEMNTYFPVTKKKIAESYGYFGNVNIDNIYISEISFLIGKALYGNLDENKIRAEIIFPNGNVIYIDANGGAQIGDKQIKLSLENKERINNLLKLLTSEKIWTNNGGSNNIKIP